MAQLISFAGSAALPGTTVGMPNVPGFQWMATRNFPKSPTSFPGGLYRLPLIFVNCVANTGHALLGKTVVFTFADVTVTFEFTEGGSPSPGNVAVPIVNNDTAAAVADALATAYNTWAAANFTGVGSAQTLTLPQWGITTDTCSVVLSDPSLAPVTSATAPSPATGFTIVRNYIAGAAYGAGLLQRAWKAFVFPGVDPELVSVIDLNDDTALDFTLGMLPLRGAFPVWATPQSVNPIADRKIGEEG